MSSTISKRTAAIIIAMAVVVTALIVSDIVTSVYGCGVV